MLRFAIACVIGNILCATNVHSQSPSISPNYFASTSLRQALAEVIEDQQSIFSGPNYDQYFTRLSSNGHPYFDLKGVSIEYNLVEYKNITFLYDIYLDEVVVLRPNEKDWITLNRNHVSQFNMGGRAFRNVGGVLGLEPGFYEVAASDDNVQLLAKWSKTFTASTWNTKLTIYIVKGKAYSIRSKKMLLQILNDKQAELRQFIKENHLKFKRNSVEDYAKVVRHYSSLVKK